MPRPLAVLMLLLVLVATATPSQAASTVVLPRAGQVGIGVAGTGGTLLAVGGLGSEFGAGGGLAVRLRYRMRFDRAFGLTFESQKLGARDATGGSSDAFDSTGEPAVPRDRLQATTAGIEFYQLFDTRERTVKMVSAGLGLGQLSADLQDGGTQVPRNTADALYVSLGAGLERFAFRSVAWELGTTYRMLLHDGKVNHGLQAHLGFVFYAAY